MTSERRTLQRAAGLMPAGVRFQLQFERPPSGINPDARCSVTTRRACSRELNLVTL